MTVQEAIEMLKRMTPAERQAVVQAVRSEFPGADSGAPGANAALDEFLAQAGRGIADSPDASADKYAHLHVAPAK